MSGVAEVSSTYLAEMASNSIPVGYKQTEVGVIPEDWQLSNIRDVSAIPMQNGLFYEPKRKGKGVPLINVGDMYTAAPVDVDSLELFNATTGEIKVFRVERGDLFFTRSSVVPSGIAYCNIFDSEREDVVFDSHLIRVRPNTEILEPRYLYLNCIAKHSRTALIAEAKTATMTTIDQGAINRCPVLVPPKKEQTAIANALSDVDALIRELEKLIAKKQAIKTATMQQLLTGRTRLPQFALREDGTPTNSSGTALLNEKGDAGTGGPKGEGQDGLRKSTKPSELGEIPEDWEVVELASIASIKTGSKNNQDKVLDGVYPFFVRSETVERLNSFSYDCEAILVPGEGGIGSIFHYINGKFDAHQRVYVIRNFSNCIGKYIYFQMRNNFGSHAMENSVKATVDSLRLPTFLEFKVLLPAKEEQTAIATILSDMDAEIQALEQRLGKTRHIKQGMMQELLTGRVRLISGELKVESGK